MNRSTYTICLLLLVLLAGAGCASREHMSEDYGRQTRSFFSKQRVNQTPAIGSADGLDSEESTAIRDRYQEQLAPEDKTHESDNSSRVLVLEESRDGKSK